MISKILFCLFFVFIYHFTFHNPVYADPPKRIISLAPNITEILFALGLSDSVAGVTVFCDYPEEAKEKQKIGGMSNPSLEGVVSLKPDIVVMTTNGNPKEFEERLRSLRVRTYVFKALRFSDLPQAIREMGSSFDVKERADSLASRIETSLKKLKITGHSQKKKVLFIIWPEPLIVAGPNTAMDDAITLLGNENIASKAKTSYPKYSVEKIIRQAPDVIIIGKGHENMQEVSARLLKRLKSVPAVKNNKIYYVSDRLYRLGPRVIKGIEEIADCLIKS
jgi:iron complex transport system substrate-binding protein